MALINPNSWNERRCSISYSLLCRGIHRSSPPTSSTSDEEGDEENVWWWWPRRRSRRRRHFRVRRKGRRMQYHAMAKGQHTQSTQALAPHSATAWPHSPVLFCGGGGSGRSGGPIWEADWERGRGKEKLHASSIINSL